MAHWTSLMNFNTRYMSVPTKINHDEFIVVGNEYNKIFRYSISKNTITKENVAINPNLDLVAFNTSGFIKDNKPYIYICNNAGNIGLYDVSKRRIRFKHSLDRTGGYPEILYTDNNIHVIGAYSNRFHKIISINSDDKYTELIVKQFGMDFNLFGHRMIHSQKRNSILLFAAGKNEHVYEYSFKTQEWRELDGIIPPEHILWSGMVITSDQRNIIFLGGRTQNSDHRDTISIFDIDEMRFKTSCIRTPQSGLYRAVLIGNRERDDLLAVGWIKKCWKSAEFKNMMNLPDDIIRMIQDWIGNDDIHLIGFEKHEFAGYHWKIDVDSILQFV